MKHKIKKKIFKNINNIWDIENNFFLYSHSTRLDKVISHYEIFKKTLNIPGAIIECGVFKGASLIKFLTFRNFLKKKKKKVIGFDVFGKFPKQKIFEDNLFAKKHDKDIGIGIKLKILKKIILEKNFKNYKLIKGNIEATIPKFLSNNKDLKISFLHLDLDVYKPTFSALNLFYNRVSKNGIILIDDYSRVPGATKATNDFLKNHKNIKLEKLDFGAKLYFIKKP